MPLVAAPMAEALTGASRATVQRNLTWMEARSLIREVTSQRLSDVEGSGGRDSESGSR